MLNAKLVGLAVVVMAGTALGQGDKPLSGPPVKQDRPAGLGGQFAEGKGDRKGPMTERVPMRLYAQAIDKLRGEDAPAGLRLTPEQDKQIAAIEDDFKETMRAYIQKARPAAGQGQRKRPLAGGDEPMTPEAQAERARMQELMRNAPNPTDAQVKVYALLSDGQKKFVEAEVAKAQGEMEKRRTEEYMQRQLQKKKGEPAPAAGAVPSRGAPPAGGMPEGRERFRRLMERLQQLSPEERDQFLNRIEAELDRRGIGAGGEGKGPRRPGGGEKKPAPKIDEVKVPPPEKP